MCTAATYQAKDFYCGRNLDYEMTYGESMAVTPRHFPLPGVGREHYAMIGIAHVRNGYPLYYDAVNEKGLCVAGLNFVGNAVYGVAAAGREAVPQYAFIPWLLGRCATLRQAQELLERTAITGQPFCADLPPAQLHWMVADRSGCLVVEPLADGLHLYDDPVGVLTNNPPFPEQLRRLSDYQQLSAQPPVNRFSSAVPAPAYSRGMGAFGLPGDLSSPSRFVRAAFVRLNSRSGEDERSAVHQFFHILSAVEQPRGCCAVGEERYEFTQYSCCCNADRGIYYTATYEDRTIRAMELHRENPDGEALTVRPLGENPPAFT